MVIASGNRTDQIARDLEDSGAAPDDIGDMIEYIIDVPDRFNMELRDVVRDYYEERGAIRGNINQNNLGEENEYEGLEDLFREYEPEINEYEGLRDLFDEYLAEYDGRMPKTGSFGVGADYKGIKTIVEEDKENIYIPSSDY